MVEVEVLDADQVAEAAPALAELLAGAVAGGEQAGAPSPLPVDSARDHWRAVAADVAAGGAVVAVAVEADALLGVAELRPAAEADAPHRAELRRIIVHASARRRGIARRLVAALEGEAGRRGRTLLLAAPAADGPAERLLRSAGYRPAGRIGSYLRTNDGSPLDATLLVRRLSVAEGAEGVTVRAARVEDAEAMGAIHVRGWQAAYAGIMPAAFLEGLDPGLRESQWRETLTWPQPSGRVWVAERDGAVVGFAATGTSRDPDAVSGTAELNAIYIEPDLVGAGIGRRLLDHALGDLRRRGARSITLWVLEANARARRVYESAGLRPDGAEKALRVAGESLAEVRYRMTVDGRGASPSATSAAPAEPGPAPG